MTKICLPISGTPFSTPTSIDKRYMQALHGKGTYKSWPRAMIVASKGLQIFLIEGLTSRDTTCANLHNKDEELVIFVLYIKVLIFQN